MLWEGAPDGVRVAFATRLGGVSEGPFASLNLGLLTDDEPERVVENRRRACEAAGIDAASATMALQVHGARVTEARPTGVVTPGTDYEPCDGRVGRDTQAIRVETTHDVGCGEGKRGRAVIGP